MNLEWFDRVCAELQEHLESICEEYDQVGQLTITKAAKHPRIEFFVDTEDEERDYFSTLFYDPNNEEFYMESFDFETDQTVRVLLDDIEDIIDAVHDDFHDYMEDDSEYVEEYIVSDEDDNEEVEYLGLYDDDYADDEYDDEDLDDEIDVEWETPEVTAYLDADEELEVTYKFGIVQETGDGILQRINRLKTADDELIRDEFNFIFSKEEASTIIAMIASHMDSVRSLEDF